MFFLNVLYQCRMTLNSLTIMSYITIIITTLDLPYPSIAINVLLQLILHIANAFKGSVDNKTKGFVLEFLENCQSLIGSGEIDDSLYESVKKELGSLTYMCFIVCSI